MKYGVYVNWDAQLRFYVGQGGEGRRLESLKERSCIAGFHVFWTDDPREAYVFEDELWCYYWNAGISLLNKIRPKWSWRLPFDWMTAEDLAEVLTGRSYYFQSEEYRELMRQVQRRPEVKEKKTVALRIALNQPKVKLRASVTQKEVQNLPEIKEKHHDSLVAAHARPATKERHSAAMKEVASRPEVREKNRLKKLGNTYTRGRRCPPKCTCGRHRRKSEVVD